MPTPLAFHCDRIARRTAAFRPGVVLPDVPRGWARLRPGGDEGEVPSTTFNRVHWFTADSPLTPADLDGMAAVLRAHNARRVFIWISQAARDNSGDAELRRVGAEPWPFVRYFVLARRAAPISPPRPTTLAIRRVDAADIRPVMAAAARLWYDPASADAVSNGVESGIAEIHAAFDGDQPVAIASFTLDRADPAVTYAYLGWAGTSPAHRNHGAQSALIAARVTRAAELGATWCVSETNTAIETSLNNLARSGFVPTLEWHVYQWLDVQTL